MANIPTVNQLIVDQKQTVVALNGEVVDLDESSRPSRDIGIDDVIPDTSDPTPSATNGGTGGAEPSGTARTPQDPIATRNFVYVRRTTRLHITDFTDGFIQACQAENAVPIAVFNDDTERQVTWDEVFDPRTPSEAVIFDVGSIAAAKNQHFWHDDQGAHVTDNTAAQWTTEYQKTNHGELANPPLDKPWHNILMNSLGILLRRGLLNMASLSRSAIAFYDGTGNTENNVMAMFGIDGAQIGRNTEKHMVLNDEGINVYNADGTLAPLHASNIEADHAIIANLDSNYAHIANGVIDNASIDVARVNNLSTSYARITNGVIDNAKIDVADVNNLSTSYARITNGVIDNAKISYADVEDLAAHYARVTNGVIDNATIGYADVNGLSTHYASITNGVIDNAKISYADVNDLAAHYARVTNGVIDNASIDVAKVNNLSTSYARITNGVIDNATIDVADVNNLSTSYARITNGVIDNAKISYADVKDLSTHYAQITNGVISNATIGYANVNGLSANYAAIDFANVNNGWITNGTIKNGAISNAMISDVSANKLTAGTIDASVITVSNLQAENIKVNRINGQTVTNKSVADALGQHEDDISDLDDRLTAEITALSSRVDSQIQTFTGNAVPTLNNYPAQDWTTNAIRQEHVGDLFYVINPNDSADGYSYRFAYDNTTSTYSWALIRDTQVTDALQRLLDAEGDIDGLQQFQTQITSWKTDTDEDLSSLKSSRTSLTTRVGNLETNKVDTSTFNTVSQTVNQNSSNINNLTTSVNNMNGTLTTVSNTVNNVQQTAGTNSATISNLTTRLGVNADGTAGANDVVQKVSAVEQDLSGFKTTVSGTYATQANLNNEINRRKATYVSSTTAEGTAAKVGTCANFELYTGAQIVCTFSKANTHKTPTLNVNGTGAKQIRSFTGAALSVGEYSWKAGQSIPLVYDGTYWRIQDNGSTNRLYNAETSITQTEQELALRASKTEVEGLEAALNTLEQEAIGLSYSHTYEHNNNTYEFTAKLMNGTVDITDDVDPMRFIWYLKDEEDVELAGRGVTFSVSGNDIGYRGSVIGGYEDAGSHSYELVDLQGRPFVTIDTNQTLMANIVWED